jgi:transposase
MVNCDPKELSQLAKASLKNKKVELAASLHGFYSEHFRWLLSEAMQEPADLDRKLEQVDKRLAKQLQSHADLILRLCTIPGVDFTTAAMIIAEVGFDMSRFPTRLTWPVGLGCRPATTKVRANVTPVPPAKETGICEEF